MSSSLLLFRALPALRTAALLPGLRRTAPAALGARAAAAANPAALGVLHQQRRGAAKGAKGVAKKVKDFPVETDTHRLSTHCCGLDYRCDGQGPGDPELRPDAEYPEWLFSMDVGRPRPTSDQMEPGTLEYFLQLRKEHVDRLHKIRAKRKKKKKQ